MNDINMGDSLVMQRERHEFEKYGRRPHPQLAAHPHQYFEHSIEPSYGHFDRPINEPNQ